MPCLPVPGGRDVVRVFDQFGWHVARQQGRHIVLVKPDHIATPSVPDHMEIAKGTLRRPIRADGATVQAFAAGAEEL